jgi:predicted Zn-dependent protease
MTIDMKVYFAEMADHACAHALDDELVLCWFSAEASDFLRFNHALVRQAMHIRQISFTVSLIQGQRRLQQELMLAGHDEDRLAIDAAIASMRGNLPQVPDDPYLSVARQRIDTNTARAGLLPEAATVIEAVAEAAGQHDFVGFYAGGPTYRGFANSLGQRNWHQVDSFHFDWCLYHGQDKAIKAAYAGEHWETDVFAERVRAAAERLPMLGRPAKVLAPGEYRVFLTPTAVNEILRTLCWEGFSEKAVRTRQSPLAQLYEESATLHPDFSLTEDIAGGLMPSFQADGFVKPAQVPLVRAGRAAGALASARTATEYGMLANADNAEMPGSLQLEGGSLDEMQALAALGTGIWVSNLWYLNYSDRQACRLTGMTRFACFWVEDGAIVAPINVMRFDDTVYRMFGSELEALTQAVDVVADGDTYKERSATSTRTPGALIRNFRFTL